MADLLKSLVLMLIVSASVSLFISQWDINFWVTFLFVTILQIVGWKVFTYYSQLGIIKKAQEIEEEAVKNIGKQEIAVPCASCEHENVQLVELNGVNTFVCEACDVKNAICINIETAAMTVPADEIREAKR